MGEGTWEERELAGRTVASLCPQLQRSFPNPPSRDSGFKRQGIRRVLEVGAFQNVGVLRF